MSIQSEITRIKTNVNNISSTLKNIGVEVSDDVKSDDISSLIIVNNLMPIVDATATADEIFEGEIAYTNDGKTTGTFTLDNELAEQSGLINEISQMLEGKAIGGIDTTDATATSTDILEGKTAYANDQKITGSIPTKTSSDLSINGATVTVPSGYYASQATKSVSGGSAKTPATTITKNPTISVDSAGKITASVSGTQSVTPTVTAGYVSSGIAGTITVSGSNTKQLTTQAAKTITPSTSSQTAVNSGVYTTGTVTVNPIPSSYIVPSGTKSITTNGTHDVKAYASATVNVAGEDVTSETNAYTNKLATLETAITALETELQNKTSGGSGGSVETCTGTIESMEIAYPNSVWFLNSDMQPTSLTPVFKKATTFTAIKGSFIFINGSTTINRTLEGVTLLYSNGYNIIVSIDSDGFTIIT